VKEKRWITTSTALLARYWATSILRNLYTHIAKVFGSTLELIGGNPKKEPF
jgi:hypothetical protein